jgi:hypothetical protein
MTINATSSYCCNPITHTVKWFRESISNETLRKTTAVFAAVLLTLTVVGIPLVYLAYYEWEEQDFDTNLMDYGNNLRESDRNEARSDAVAKARLVDGLMDQLFTPPLNQND